MYDIKFVNSRDEVLEMGHNNTDIAVADLKGIDGLEVTVNTSRSFNQIGFTVDSTSIGSRKIMLTGKVYNFTSRATKEINRFFVPGANVRLHFENKYWIDCVVSSSPVFSYKQTMMAFSISLYCAYPYWRKESQSHYSLGGLIGGFNFPVSYNTPHNFALFSEMLLFNCVNNGAAAVPFNAEIVVTAGTNISEITITNAQNQKFFRLNGRFSAGDKINVFYENGMLNITKTTESETTNIFNALDVDSTLYELDIGDNILRAEITKGTGALTVAMTFYDVLAGVTYDI